MKAYKVSFDIKHHGIQQRIFIIVLAHNANEAKEKAKRMWTNFNQRPHMFHIEAHCIVDFKQAAFEAVFTYEESGKPVRTLL